VTFDVLQLLEVVGVDYSFNFTATYPFNDRFDELGYGSQNTFDNFGSINYILVFMVLESLVFVVLKLDIGRDTRVGQRLRRKFSKTGTSAMWISFCLQLNFDVLLMCLLTVLKGEFPNLLELSQT